MRIKNYTDLDINFIRAVIRAVRPPGISNFDVQVKNTPGPGKGVSYSKGSSYHDRSCPFVTVYVPETEEKARSFWNLGGAYLPMWLGSRKEVFVNILAHELRHQWQAKVKKGRRVWGSRGQFSERDADAYSLQMVRRYRRGELNLDIRSDMEESDETNVTQKAA